MANSWNLAEEIITLEILLDPPPTPRRGFGTPLYACASIDPAGTFGAGVKTYTGPTDVLADTTLPSDIAADLLAAFEQEPKVSQIRVAGLSVVEDEYTQVKTIVPALATQCARIEAANQDWYVLVLESRGLDTDAINAAVPAARTYLNTLTKCVLVQHHDKEGSLLDNVAVQTLNLFTLYMQLPDDDIDERYPAAIAWASARMAFDIDLVSAPWTGRVIGIPASDLTVVEWRALTAKGGNALRPLGGNAAVAYPGFTASNQPIYLKFTIDWLRARVQEDFATQANVYWDRGEKWPLNEIGLLTGEAIIDSRVRQGRSGRSPHFNDASPSVGQEITATDRTLKRLRWNVVIQTLDGAIRFGISGVVSSEPIAQEV